MGGWMGGWDGVHRRRDDDHRLSSVFPVAYLEARHKQAPVAGVGDQAIGTDALAVGPAVPVPQGNEVDEERDDLEHHCRGEQKAGGPGQQAHVRRRAGRHAWSGEAVRGWGWVAEVVHKTCKTGTRQKRRTHVMN